MLNIVWGEQGSLLPYGRLAKNIQLLNAEQEMQLAVDFYNNRTKDSFQQLVVSHLPLVFKMAYSYRGYGLPVQDLVSEGVIGLMRAVTKFNPFKGNRLSTYAMWWIKAYITDYILNSWSLVKSGTLMARKKLFFSLNKIKNKLGIFSNQLSSAEVLQIAHETGTSQKDVLDICGMLANKDFSIDSSADNDDNNVAAIDYMVLEDSDPENEFADKQEGLYFKHLISQVLEVLNDRERDILVRRYVKERAESLESIGKSLGISRERVRQIEVNALKKAKLFLQNHNMHSL